MNLDRGFRNVIVLSWGFMLVFTAFQTMSNIQQTVLNKLGLQGIGFTSLAIVYASLSICNWIAPSFISLTGPRTAIITGCSTYVFFIASFLWPQALLICLASALLGFGAALAWTGHGQYLTLNSNPETMSRNSGLFWAIFQLSMFSGNFFVAIVFKGEEITVETSAFIFKVLTVVSLVGLVLLLTMRPPPQALSLGPAEGVSSADKELHIPEQPRERPLLAAWTAFKDAFTLLFTPRMLLLNLTFIYTGLVLGFFAVYSTSIGATKDFGDIRNSLLGMSGIFLGVGEIIGGAVFGILSSKLGKLQGWIVVLIGTGLHVAVYLIALANLSNDAPLGETEKTGFLNNPIAGLAMIGSLALGLGDACFNTQVYSLLGTIYANKSAPAFALFKFSQSVATATSFTYSLRAGLYVQIGILVVSMILGCVSFCLVDIRNERSKRMSECPEVDSLPVNSAMHFND